MHPRLLVPGIGIKLFQVEDASSMCNRSFPQFTSVTKVVLRPSESLIEGIVMQSREIMYHRLNINRIMAGYCSQPIEKVSPILALWFAASSAGCMIPNPCTRQAVLPFQM